MKALNVIRKPVITEKASLLEEKRVYAFWVNPKATKIDVKNAFHTLYGADVDSVRLLKAAPKFKKIAKGMMNKRAETVKAYIAIKGKTKLDLNKFGKVETESKVKLAAPKKATKTPSKKTK